MTVNAPAGTQVVDPVCGMTISPESAAGSHVHGGRTYYFCARSCLERFRENPGAFVAETAAPRHERRPAAAEYTCPMHPEVRADRPGACPICGMALEPVAMTADEPRTSPSCADMTRRFRVERRAHRAAGRCSRWARCSRPRTRCSATACWRCAVDRARAGHAGRAVGRLAVLRARLAVDRQPQPEHVHADRARRRRRVRCSAWSPTLAPGLFPAVVPRRTTGSVGVYFEAAAVIVDAGAAGPGARAARAQPDRRGDPRAARPRPEDGAARRGRRDRGGRAARATSSPATACACGPARRCRWTAWCSRARARSTSRWSPASRCRSRSAPGDRGDRRHGERHGHRS